LISPAISDFTEPFVAAIDESAKEAGVCDVGIRDAVALEREPAPASVDLLKLIHGCLHGSSARNLSI
jgi:hypothetical protein